MASTVLSRDSLAEQFLAQLPFPPYPVQEEALLTWFTTEQGVLVCAPTGTGKTLIAEAALFEALHTGQTAYYTTPLIALTEQKFREMQAAAVRWGFRPGDVGLVTGNRRVNPDAKVLVVVAEILLNRLLHTEAFDFADVSAVVMDEFHSFADPERGIVWELSLGLLPKQVRLLLLSATVGNAVDFVLWLQRAHGRLVELVQGTERRVPLSYQWVPDLLLNEHLEWMASGDADSRRTPALVFCFNRDECWDVAEQLKGKSLLADGQQKLLAAALEKYDLSTGAGPKLKQILMRGVGVHHAGLLPKYKRVVEELFQRKLLSVAVCTETLSAGMNLPARSVVLTALMKGPPGRKKLIEPSTAHQIFGRAGRPQFDKQGFVYALAHEDDVKILRWKERFDQIPADTKDPLLIRAKKELKRKMPTRRNTEQYWTPEQFARLQTAPPGRLNSQGPLPWRLLAYLLRVSPDVVRLRDFVNKRLLEGKHFAAAQKELDQRLLSLWAGGYVTLEPEPPPRAEVQAGGGQRVVGSENSDSQLQISNLKSQISNLKFENSNPPAAADEFGVGLDDEDDAAMLALPQEEGRGEVVEISNTELKTDFPIDEQSSPPAVAQPQPPLASLPLALSQGQRGPDKKPSRGARLLIAKAAETGHVTSAELTPLEEAYRPQRAIPTERLDLLMAFRSVNPIYGMFLVELLGHASFEERIQAFESVLEIPRSAAKYVRVPRPDILPFGPLALEYVHPQLLSRGLATAAELGAASEEDEGDWWDEDDRPRVLTFAEKLRLLFQSEFPDVHDVFVQPCWAVGELIRFGGNFHKLVSARQAVKQEGVLFRHLLRFVLLLEEFGQLTPPDLDAEVWRAELRDLATQVTASCRDVDSQSTDQMLEEAHAAAAVIDALR